MVKSEKSILEIFNKMTNSREEESTPIEFCLADKGGLQCGGWFVSWRVFSGEIQSLLRNYFGYFETRFVHSPFDSMAMMGVLVCECVCVGEWQSIQHKLMVH